MLLVRGKRMDHEPLLVKRTNKRNDEFVFDDLDELTEVIDDFRVPFGLKRAIFHSIRQGEVGEWLEKTGNKELASFLKSFEKDLDGYLMAINLFQKNRKMEKKNFSFVIGYETAKRKLLEAGCHADKFEEISKRYNKKSGGAILLYGPPGCGKTYLANCFAGETSKFFMKRGGAEFFDPRVMRSTISSIKKIKNTVLFIDEMEMLGVDRDVEGLNSRALTNQILVSIDSDIKKYGILIIGATNTPWVMDPSVLRSGRFDEFIYMGFPSFDERKKLLEFYASTLPKEKLDFESIAEKTEFYSCSDLEAICSEAAAIPWREAINGETARKLNQDDLEKALLYLEPTSIPWLENACNVVFSQNMKVRFSPMVAEIERYKRKRG